MECLYVYLLFFAIVWNGKSEKFFLFCIFWTADGIPIDSSDSEMEDRTTANLASLKLDEWLNFKLEPEVSCSLVVW